MSDRAFVNKNMDVDITERMHSVSHADNRTQLPLMSMPTPSRYVDARTDDAIGSRLRQGRVAKDPGSSIGNSLESVSRQRALPHEDMDRIGGRYISGARQFP